MKHVSINSRSAARFFITFVFVLFSTCSNSSEPQSCIKSPFHPSIYWVYGKTSSNGPKIVFSISNNKLKNLRACSPTGF